MLTGAAVAVGGALLLLAAYLPTLQGGAASPQPLSTPPADLAPPTDFVDGSEPSVARRATVPNTTAAAASQADLPPVDSPHVPRIVDAAPVEALPATRLLPLAQAPPSRSGSSSATSVSGPAAPFSVALVSEGAAAEPLATRLAERLVQAGFDVKRSDLADAGRPDALLLVATTAATVPSVWYCQPGSDGSPQLANQLLGVLASLPSTGAIPAAPDAPLPCDQVYDGRARSAAALLELPAGALTDARTTGLVADGLQRYFSQNATSIRRDRAARLVWPASGPITSYYGPSHPLGIDIGEWSGDIVAATDGVVSFAGGDPCCSYGNYVVIDSTAGIRTLYAHLTSLRVKTGQRVQQGQVLGPVGCTGNCSGPHLHFEVIDKGTRVDPLHYLP